MTHTLILLIALTAPARAMEEGRTTPSLSFCSIAKRLFSPLLWKPTLSKPTVKIPQALQKKIGAYRNEKYDPDLLFTSITPSDLQAGPKNFKGFRIDLFYEGEAVGHCDFNYGGDSMRFDIILEKPFRGAGLYEELLKTAIEMSPSPIKTIPVRMSYSFSSNSKRIVDEVFGNRQTFREFVVSGLPEENSNAMREKIVAAVKKSSLYNARVAAGYGDLQKIIMSPKEGDVILVFAKGKPTEKFRVILEGDTTIELPGDGTIVKNVPSPDLNLGNFPEPLFAIPID